MLLSRGKSNGKRLTSIRPLTEQKGFVCSGVAIEEALFEVEGDGTLI